MNQGKDVSQRQEKFFYGSLLPDAGGKEQKQSSHFWNRAEGNQIIMTPDINRFLSKYAAVIHQNPLYGGYLTHLHLDREFWNSYIKDQVEFLDANGGQTEYTQNLKNVLIKRTGRIITPEEFFSKNYLYGDYTRLKTTLGSDAMKYISAEEEDIDYSDDENTDAVDISDVPEVTLGCKVVIRNIDRETKTYKYDMVNGMLPKAVEVFTGCKVGDAIEMMGKEWRIEDIIF